MTENKEKQFTGASYLISFYSEVQQLNHNYSVYVNQLTELRSKGLELDTLKEEDRSSLQSVVNAVRHSCTKVFIMYVAISENLKKENNKEITKVYERIRDTYIISLKDILEFVTKINKYLVSSVIGSLLESNQEIVNTIFDNANSFKSTNS